MMEGKDIKKSNSEADENIKTKNLEPEIWVDIGARYLPVGGVKEKLKELKNKIYIGIDIHYEKKDLDDFKKSMTEEHQVEEKNFFNIIAYGQKTPFKDNSCHQVFLANILGAPLIKDETKEDETKEETKKDETKEASFFSQYLRRSTDRRQNKNRDNKRSLENFKTWRLFKYNRVLYSARKK